MTISIGLEVCVRNTTSALPLEPVHIGIVTYRYRFGNRTPYLRPTSLFDNHFLPSHIVSFVGQNPVWGFHRFSVP